ncbi:hypothetical protein U9M48_000103 [Paspalum notatum var. saurae]|uniref:Uncharacterized protein n=1 Tax=Paspalum notatum var. saurae TaxID=547442 RepID=A0AAQ3PHQ8_PASNO
MPKRGLKWQKRRACKLSHGALVLYDGLMPKQTESCCAGYVSRPDAKAWAQVAEEKGILGKLSHGALVLYDGLMPKCGLMWQKSMAYCGRQVFTSISTGILERSTATLVVPSVEWSSSSSSPSVEGVVGSSSSSSSSVVGVVVIRLVFQNLHPNSAGHPETLP